MEKKDWEEEFDVKFSNWAMMAPDVQNFEDFEVYDRLKDFIREQITRERARVVEEIRGKVDEMKIPRKPVLRGQSVNAPSHVETWEQGFNRALDEVLDSVTKGTE